jgi:hypothetical protein
MRGYNGTSLSQILFFQIGSPGTTETRYWLLYFFINQKIVVILSAPDLWLGGFPGCVAMDT